MLLLKIVGEIYRGHTTRLRTYQVHAIACLSVHIVPTSATNRGALVSGSISCHVHMIVKSYIAVDRVEMDVFISLCARSKPILVTVLSYKRPSPPSHTRPHHTPLNLMFGERTRGKGYSTLCVGVLSSLSLLSYFFSVSQKQ